jgi:hypothetical protein
MKNAIFTILVLSLTIQARAQDATLRGRILDIKDKSPLVGVYVKLVNPKDTSEVHMTSTDVDGAFTFQNLSLQTYVLEAVCVGYDKLRKTVRVERPAQNIGEVLLSQGVIPLGEIVIEGIMPAAVQKADTTEFMSKAFKTHPDADAGDLLAKMPGITIDNTGTVKTNGENVQQILVDGKPFFGGDPTIALHNLPAEAIEKIQVFDKLSDQAEFTGFDDGNSLKTINLILRPERRNSQFGKTYGGYGDDQRYLAGGNANYLDGASRVSVIGLADNVNQQNFSSQDLLGVLSTNNNRGGLFSGGANGRRAGGGGGGRGAGGGGGGRGAGGGGAGSGGGAGGAGAGAFGSAGNFLVGQQSGITTTNSVGSNYSDTWWKGFLFNGSYFFNETNNENDQSLNRQYSVPQDSINTYNQNSNSGNKNYNHRFDSRVEYTIDSSNSMIDLPRLYFQSNRTSSALAGTNAFSPTQLLSHAENDNGGNTSGNNLSNHFVLRHRFDTPGRTVSLDFGLGYNHKTGGSNLQSLAEYYQGSGNTTDTVDQHSNVLTNSSSVSARIVYTEPIGGVSLLQLNYSPSYSYSESDNRKFDLDPLTREYTTPDLSLSNTYHNTNIAQNGGLGYLLRWSGFTMNANLSYQQSTLRGDQIYPVSSSVDRVFYNFLPSLNLNYTISDHSNLRVFYRTSTRAPSIGQLQNVVDNSNPLVLTTGNPGLDQSYNHTLVSRYSVTNAGSAQSFFLLFSVQRTNNYIANSTFTATHDTLLTGGVLMKSGTQLVYPVNLDGSWNGSTFATYSFPVGMLKSILNLNSGLTYTQAPGLINRQENYANTYTISEGLVISSNISEDVDFTLSYMGNYNVARNTLDATLNNNYYSHNASFKLNLIFWQGVVFRNEMTNSLYNGLSAGYNQNFTLWNISLGKKFFTDQSVEIRLTATDILNQNKSISRSVTETYIQDTQNNVLRQYVMLNCTYTMK